MRSLWRRLTELRRLEAGRALAHAAPTDSEEDNADLVRPDLAGERYLDAALANLAYLQGRNANGYWLLLHCFVTGFDSRSPRHFHDRLSAADGVDDPVPVWPAGGSHDGRQDPAEWLSPGFLPSSPPGLPGRHVQLRQQRGGDKLERGPGLRHRGPRASDRGGVED